MPAIGHRQAAPLRVAVREDPRVVGVFTDRAAGNASLATGGGDALAARRRALGAVGLGPEHGVFMEQVHGSRVAVVGAADRGRGVTELRDAVQGTDALVTTDTDVGLVVLVADCVPALLAAPGRAVAAAHAGRRGIARGVLAATVAALTRAAGAEPAELVAVTGPAIGGCCYEVPGEVARAVTARVPAAQATTAWGTTALDLPAAAEAQLRDAGVGRVERAGSCTRCDAARWYSHRASSGWGAPAGRQAGVIARVTRNTADRYLD